MKIFPLVLSIVISLGAPIVTSALNFNVSPDAEKMIGIRTLHRGEKSILKFPSLTVVFENKSDLCGKYQVWNGVENSALIYAEIITSKPGYIYLARAVIETHCVGNVAYVTATSK